MQFGPRRIGTVVMWLLILNFVIFILTISQNLKQTLFLWGAVMPDSPAHIVQIWRLVTFQFLHWNGTHFLFNMLFLFFFGPILEQLWGSRTFLKFYLISGAFGGLVYTLLSLFGVLPPGIMVGASGGLYAIMAAVAIMYPRMPVLIWGLIPVKMIWLVILAIIISLLKFTVGKNAGGEAAHLSGLLAGFLYVKYKPLLLNFQLHRKKGSWQKKMEQERSFEVEVDRVLKKVHQEGISSLSRRERQILQEATRREQMTNQK